MTKLSVVIPAKNEQENVLKLIEEIINALSDLCSFEIIVVDDGSDDQTFNKLKLAQQQYSASIRILRHAHSTGQSTAVYNGVLIARGELVATLDGDGQNDPTDIPKLLIVANEFAQGADFCIAGYRKCRHDSRWKLLQSRIANSIRSTLLKDDTPDTGCGLKIFPRSTFIKLPYFDHMHRFLPALIKRSGGSIRIVEVNHRARHTGTSKYTMLNRAWAGVIDMLGVIWLQKRNRLPVQSEEH
ncbi:glycosyltransferase family 2 protein [Lacimicrobium alkaliphilum]|uniref:Dolichol-phosphate mannosyltransferase n=1 Tax=Lacimicrobium alkaliphilum TaxID=1526571 RepID=A0ABQ1RHV4_9ALTE|nr:glycosyltransferase family 2 protein [Lacimicrobium alkaliphilum]GGD68688.1 dolichol-phosphate mannosyltransferase [Lacimicrobium alkaliphilum]